MSLKSLEGSAAALPTAVGRRPCSTSSPMSPSARSARTPGPMGPARPSFSRHSMGPVHRKS